MVLTGATTGMPLLLSRMLHEAPKFVDFHRWFFVASAATEATLRGFGFDTSRWSQLRLKWLLGTAIGPGEAFAATVAQLAPPLFDRSTRPPLATTPMMLMFDEATPTLRIAPDAIGAAAVAA